MLSTPITSNPAVDAFIAGTSTIGAGLLAVIPESAFPPEGLGTEWGRFGAIGFMALIAIISVVGLYKSNLDSRRSSEKMLEQFIQSRDAQDAKIAVALENIARATSGTNSLLAERPCIRHPENN